MSGAIVRIKGVVIPAEWDSKGNAIGVAISAWDEVEYRIEKDNIGDILLGHMHEKVEVSGELKESGNVKAIKVKQVHAQEKKVSKKKPLRNLQKGSEKE
jgi:predicted NodU family carbamoyl transferase